MNYFLGLEIARSSSILLLSQRKYHLQILDDASFFNAKLGLTPMDPNLKLSKTDRILLSQEEATVYRRLIGRLLYLQIFRPDICFAMHRQPIFTSTHLFTSLCHSSFVAIFKGMSFSRHFVEACG